MNVSFLSLLFRLLPHDLADAQLAEGLGELQGEGGRRHAVVLRVKELEERG